MWQFKSGGCLISFCLIINLVSLWFSWHRCMGRNWSSSVVSHLKHTVLMYRSLAKWSDEKWQQEDQKWTEWDEKRRGKMLRMSFTWTHEIFSVWSLYKVFVCEKERDRQGKERRVVMMWLLSDVRDVFKCSEGAARRPGRGSKQGQGRLSMVTLP